MYVGVVPVVRSSRAGKFVVCIGSVVDEYSTFSRYGLYGGVSVLFQDEGVRLVRASEVGMCCAGIACSKSLRARYTYKLLKDPRPFHVLSTVCYIFYTQLHTKILYSYLGYCNILLTEYDLCVYSLMVAACILGLMLEVESLRYGSWLGY
jgi:hypothetical protein